MADAIDIYKAFIQASHEAAADPADESLAEPALALMTEDGPARQALLDDMIFMRENGYHVEGEARVKRAQPQHVDLDTGQIVLAACLDLSDVRPVGGDSSGRNPYVIEYPELHLRDGRWLVHDLQGDSGSC